MSIWVAATFNLIGTMATLVCLGITASSCKKTASIMQEILDRQKARQQQSQPQYQQAPTLPPYQSSQWSSQMC